MKLLPAILAVMALIACVSCESTGGPNPHASHISSVKTTAYTETEWDHLKHGRSTAVGTQLKYGNVRSAAADWSVYPVGTRFQIDGEPYLYEVDDYGSALVGTNTIDLYKPSKSAMSQWGARKVNIKVVKWGSFSRSVAIMRPRTNNNYIQRMVERIERSWHS
jgi:3D (Asp-Asp-Asp) domain-containing protein